MNEITSFKYQNSLAKNKVFAFYVTSFADGAVINIYKGLLVLIFFSMDNGKTFWWMEKSF